MGQRRSPAHARRCCKIAAGGSPRKLPWSLTRLRAHRVEFPSISRDKQTHTLEKCSFQAKKRPVPGLMQSINRSCSLLDLQVRDNFFCLSSVASPCMRRKYQLAVLSKVQCGELDFANITYPGSGTLYPVPLALNSSTALPRVRVLCSSLEMAASHGWKMRCSGLCGAQNGQLWAGLGT